MAGLKVTITHSPNYKVYPKGIFVAVLGTISKKLGKHSGASIRPRIPKALKGRDWEVVAYNPDRKKVMVRFDK